MNPRRLLPAGEAEGSLSSALEDRPVLFLADRQHSVSQLRQLLEDAEEAERRQLISQIVSYAPWEEIWALVSPRDLERELPHLGLSESLEAAWTLWLKRKLTN